jgi:hypothetical protein
MPASYTRFHQFQLFFFRAATLTFSVRPTDPRNKIGRSWKCRRRPLRDELVASDWGRTPSRVGAAEKSRSQESYSWSSAGGPVDVEALMIRVRCIENHLLHSGHGDQKGCNRDDGILPRSFGLSREISSVREYPPDPQPVLHDCLPAPSSRWPLQLQSSGSQFINKSHEELRGGM